MNRTLSILLAGTMLSAPAFAEDLSVVGSWSSFQTIPIPHLRWSQNRRDAREGTDATTE